MKRMFCFVAMAVLGVALLGAPGRADQAAPQAQAGMEEQVRRALITLPFYNVFDDLNYAVAGDTVTLTGKVTRPILRSDAAAVVARIPGVRTVDNQIEVLPLSRFDDHIRLAAYFKLFNYNSPLFRYGLGSDPSIHIIVENGHVTLKGTVSHQSDKQLAATYLRQVFGVFSVTNDLRVS